jgi:Cu(I)/Ag(I) efflux system membrane fusion protein
MKEILTCAPIGRSLSPEGRGSFKTAHCLVAVCSIVLLSACHHKPTEEAQSSPQLVQKNGQSYLVFKPEDYAGFSATLVKEVELPGVLETTGQVTFDDRLVKTITSRVQGRIENVRVSLWDTVTAGQPILELYSPDFMAAQEEYLQAKSTSSIQGPQSFADMSAWMVTAARRKLELLGMQDSDITAISSATTTIWMRSPMNGTILQNQVMVGQAVNPGDMLYQVGTLERVWITADIYEVDLARIHVGQRLEAVTTAFPDEIFRGGVSRISPSIDPNAHTAQIKCEISNPGLRLKPQMLARVKIITNPGYALVVPQEALVFDGNAYYAFVETAPNTVQRRQVEISSWNEQNYARIRSGLKPGERVITESLKVNALWHGTRGESY